MKSLNNQLNTLGLSENQAQTYITLLKLGNGTASQISKESGVTRTTVYDNLLILQNLKLISMTTKNDKTIFVAESPETIRDLADKKYSETLDLIAGLQEIFNSESSKPTIKIYSPLQGFERMHELSIIGNKGFKTRFLGDVNTLFTYKGLDYINNYMEKRVKIGIRNQVLTTSDILAQHDIFSYKANQKRLREIKFLPEFESMKTGLFSYDNTVWILPTSKQGYVTMINNAELSDTFNSIFGALWLIGKDVD